VAVANVVKYNGTPEVFAWKFPNETLGTWTQVIVNESQEAVLFKSGKALDIFGSGRHTLDTANIPLLNQIINIPFGRSSPFSAEIWYINKVYSLDIKWGTQTPVQLQDPKFGVFVPVSSFGQFGIRIEDSKKFLIKLVGTLQIFDKDSITKYFRGLYQTKVKDAISSYLVNEKVGILEINASLDKLSDYLKERMKPILDEYGIGLINFYINSISIPEDDSGVKMLKEALAKRAEMDIIGYSYQQERSFDTLEGAAKNPGSGSAGLMGAGIGLGIGVGMGGAVGAQFGGIAKEVNTSSQPKSKECPACRAEIDINKRFCSSCGYDTQKEKEGAGTPQIKCGACGAVLASKSKFCPECGVTLLKKCTKCNTVISDNLKFCPECGEKLG